MRYLRKNSGITLIALVITIIVLLILAAVALNIITRGNIIENANNAVDEYNRNVGNDQNLINEIDELLSQYMNGASSGGEATPTPISEQKAPAELQEGEWVKYDTGDTSVGTNGIITCRVLYNDTDHGIQLIAMQAVGEDITLGGSTSTTAIASYTDAISILNTEAENYINPIYTYDARCVGSVPTVGNGIFTLKNSEEPGPFTFKSNQVYVPNTDTNYATDWTQMGSLGTSTENIQNISANYWLASRNVYLDTYSYTLDLRCVSNSGNLGLCGLLEHYSNRDDGFSYNKALRPCFSLKPNIKVITEGGKDGTTEATAYTLAP